MKFTKISLLAASFFCLMACSEGKKNSNVAAPSNTTPTTTSAPALQTLPVAAGNEKATVALNPPHGEPGHRCDLEVGAPLDGAPANPTTIQGAPQVPVFNPPPSFSTAPSAGGTTTGAGLNPPHGQPGHDCAVAVGAPLPKK